MNPLVKVIQLREVVDVWWEAVRLLPDGDREVEFWGDARDSARKHVLKRRGEGATMALVRVRRLRIRKESA